MPERSSVHFFPEDSHLGHTRAVYFTISVSSSLHRDIKNSTACLKQQQQQYSRSPVIKRSLIHHGVSVRPTSMLRYFLRSALAFARPRRRSPSRQTTSRWAFCGCFHRIWQGEGQAGEGRWESTQEGRGYGLRRFHLGSAACGVKPARWFRFFNGRRGGDSAATTFIFALRSTRRSVPRSRQQYREQE